MTFHDFYRKYKLHLTSSTLFKVVHAMGKSLFQIFCLIWNLWNIKAELLWTFIIFHRLANISCKNLSPLSYQIKLSYRQYGQVIDESMMELTAYFLHCTLGHEHTLMIYWKRWETRTIFQTECFTNFVINLKILFVHYRL